MTPETKQILIRGGYLAATFALGMLTNHAATTASAPAPAATPGKVACECKCITPKPDPIKIEFVQPGRK